MILINFQNAEELLFSNKNIRELLPEFKNDFDSWLIAKKIPALRQLAKRSIINVLDRIELRHENIISDYYRDRIQIEKISTNLVKNAEVDLDQVCDYLTYQQTFPNLLISRNQNKIFLTSWR